MYILKFSNQTMNSSSKEKDQKTLNAAFRNTSSTALTVVLTASILLGGLACSLFKPSCESHDPGCNDALLTWRLLSGGLVPTNLYTVDGTGGYVMSIDPYTGMLSKLQGPFGAGNNPAGVQVSPDNRFLYVTSSTISAGVYAFSLTLPDQPVSIPGSPFASGSPLQQLALTKSGSHLYAGLPNTSQVRAFAVDTASGSIAEVGGSPFGTGCVSSLKTDPFSRSLFVGDGVGPGVRYHAIQSNGALNAATLVTVASSTPTTIETNASGDRLFYSSGNASATSNVYSLAISSAGVPSTPIGFPLTGASVTAKGVAMDPAGRFLYTINVTNSSLHGFTVDQTTGALTAIPGAVYPAGTTPVSVVITPDGKYVYVAASNQILGFSVKSDGTLTQITTQSGLGTANAGLSVRTEYRP